MNEGSWRDMVFRTRELEAALGTEDKKVMQNERETVILQRRAIRTNRKIMNGEKLKYSDLAVLRPCPQDALPPYRISGLVGKLVNRNIDKGDYIRIDDIE